MIIGIGQGRRVGYGPQGKQRVGSEERRLFQSLLEFEKRLWKLNVCL